MGKDCFFRKINKTLSSLNYQKVNKSKLTASLDVKNHLGHNKCFYLNSLLFWQPQIAFKYYLQNSNGLNFEINYFIV